MSSSWGEFQTDGPVTTKLCLLHLKILSFRVTVLCFQSRELMIKKRTIVPQVIWACPLYSLENEGLVLKFDLVFYGETLLRAHMSCIIFLINSLLVASRVTHIPSTQSRGRKVNNCILYACTSLFSSTSVYYGVHCSLTTSLYTVDQLP